MGFPGMFLLGILIYFFWIRFWTSTKNVETIALTSAIIIFGVFSMTQFPLHIARVGYLLPVLGGLFFISTEVEYLRKEEHVRQY